MARLLSLAVTRKLVPCVLIRRLLGVITISLANIIPFMEQIANLPELQLFEGRVSMSFKVLIECTYPIISAISC